MQAFKTNNPEAAVESGKSSSGPRWEAALRTGNLMVDGMMIDGSCHLKGYEFDHGKYNVDFIIDGERNRINPLTGSKTNKFTCTELEVFALK